MWPMSHKELLLKQQTLRLDWKLGSGFLLFQKQLWEEGKESPSQTPNASKICERQPAHPYSLVHPQLVSVYLGFC